MPQYPFQTPFGTVFVVPQDTDRVMVASKRYELRVNGIDVACQITLVRKNGEWSIEQGNRYAPSVYRGGEKVSASAIKKVIDGVMQVFPVWVKDNEDKIVSVEKVAVLNDIDRVDYEIARLERQLAGEQAKRAKLVELLSQTA